MMHAAAHSAAAAAAAVFLVAPLCQRRTSRCEGIGKTSLRLPHEPDSVLIVDGVLPDTLYHAARSEVLQFIDGGFKRAEQVEAIRSDEILWIPTNAAPPPPSSSVAALTATVAALTSLAGRVEAPGEDDKGQPLRLSAPSYVQAAVYRTTGAHYTCHRDNKHRARLNVDDDALWLRSREQRQRHVTCVLYLTPPHWDTDVHGGALRCYRGCTGDDDDGCTAVTVTDVAPVGNRLVLFRSCEVPHEVLPLTGPATSSPEPRVALTIWLLRDDD